MSSVLHWFFQLTQSDTSIAIDPLMITPRTGVSISASFNSAPCSLRLNHDTSLYSILQVIREARVLTLNIRQCFGLYLGIQTSLSATYILSLIVSEHVFDTYQLGYLLWFVGPILALSLLFTPHGSTIMTHMPVKKPNVAKDVGRFSIYYIARFILIPTSITTLVFVQLDGGVGSREFSMLVFVVYHVVISATFQSRYSVLERQPYLNRMWIGAATFTTLTTLLWLLIVLYTQEEEPSELGRFRVHLTAWIPLLGLVGVQELVKKHDLKNWTQFQKRAHLEFNTKLGMHSPL